MRDERYVNVNRVQGLTVVGVSEPSQTEAALEQIRSRIIDLSLPPGSRLDEALLLREFMLGRTPAREAISRLVAEKFVTIRPNRGGAFVRQLDLKEMTDIVMAHQLTENVLGQLCRFDDETLADDLAAIQRDYAQEVAQRHYLNITALNERFHLRMSQTVGNSFIFDFAESTHRHLRRLLVHLYRLEVSEPLTQDEQFGANVIEHEQIIEAVRNKDRGELVRLLPAHARTTQDRLIHIVQMSSIDPFPLAMQTPFPMPPGR